VNVMTNVLMGAFLVWIAISFHKASGEVNQDMSRHSKYYTGQDAYLSKAQCQNNIQPARKTFRKEFPGYAIKCVAVPWGARPGR